MVPRHSRARTVHGQELAGTELHRVLGTDSSGHGMRPHTSFFSSLVQLTPEGGAAAGAGAAPNANVGRWSLHSSALACSCYGPNFNKELKENLYPAVFMLSCKRFVFFFLGGRGGSFYFQ